MIIDDIAFRNLLGKGEEIKYVGHVHIFSVYPDLFKIMIFGVLLPAGGYFLFPPFLAAWAIWVGLGLILFAYKLLHWYLNVWLVTNLGVIDQDWNSLFDKSTTRIEHTNIEGLTTEIKGFWGTILRYGNIQIEHMSGEPVTLEKVSRPRKLERMVLFHQQAHSRQQNFEDHGKLKDLLASLLRSADKNG